MGWWVMELHVQLYTYHITGKYCNYNVRSAIIESDELQLNKYMGRKGLRLIDWNTMYYVNDNRWKVIFVALNRE